MAPHRITFDGTTRKVYVDGSQISSHSFSGSVSSSVSALVFGAADHNNSTPGADESKLVAAAKHSGIKLDEVRFYDTALSSDEISKIYNLGKGDLNKVGDFSTLPP